MSLSPRYLVSLTLTSAVSLGGVLTFNAPSAALQLQLAPFYQGPGGSGGGGATLTVVAAEALSAGQPVYADQVTGQLKRTDASALTKTNCVGLVAADTAQGFAATVERDLLTLANWTAITGAASLAVGQTYYLSSTVGQLTTVPPTTPGAVVKRVGVAVSAQALELSLSQSVLL